MRISTLTRIRRLAPFGACLLVAAAALPQLQTAAADAVPNSAMACTTSATNTFNITARDGYITTPDGNSIYMWGYANATGPFQLPGPVMCVDQNATVNVVLHNTLPEDTSIVFPGQAGVLVGSAPAQPQFDGTGALTSLTNVAPRTTGTVTYTFVAGEPGTYLYESGTDPGKQVQMGLYGALVVRPAGHPTWAYSRSNTQFTPGREFLQLLSGVDPSMHLAVERGRPFDFTTARDRYFLVNGRSMPDTVAPNGASWLPNQPYSALVHIQPNDAGNPQPALIRFVNVGSVNYPFHPHGNDQRVIARDGRLLEGPLGQDLSYTKFLFDVGPGQTLDTTLIWTDVEHWNPTTNPVPVVIPPQQDQMISPDTFYAGNPYLGYKTELPQGVTSHNQCGEYYHVAHSHALEQSTNYGASFGGMMTLIRIDPTTPNSCS